jgi:hypothetical protein
MAAASRWFTEDDVPIYTYSSRLELLYFLARFNVFIEDYQTALTYASNAFAACPDEALHNKKCLLRLLIPLKMLFGEYPSNELLEMYDLSEQFAPLRNAVRSGNLGAFDEHIDEFFVSYTNKGLIDMVLSLKVEVVFNFVRNCYKARMALFEGDAGRKLLKSFLEAALRAVNARDSFRELELLIQHLIAQGRFKGRMVPGAGVQLPFQKIASERFNLRYKESDYNKVLSYLLFPIPESTTYNIDDDDWKEEQDNKDDYDDHDAAEVEMD